MWLGTKQQLDKIVIKDVPLPFTVVTVVESARDLGVIIDSQLSMDAVARCRSLPQWLLSAAATPSSDTVALNSRCRDRLSTDWTTVTPYYMVWLTG